MTGLLVESCLRTSAESGYNSVNNVRRRILHLSLVASSYQVHQVLLTPLTGEFERAAAFIGTVFEEDNYYSLLMRGSLVFSTRCNNTTEATLCATSEVRAERVRRHAGVLAQPRSHSLGRRRLYSI